jgi:hypothetical protein
MVAAGSGLTAGPVQPPGWDAGGRRMRREAEAWVGRIGFVYGRVEGRSSGLAQFQHTFAALSIGRRWMLFPWESAT